MSFGRITAGVVAVIGIVSGCGARGAESPDRVVTCGGPMPWGGWSGSPECKAIAETVIPAADLSCEKDDDCVLVGVSACGANSVSRAASTRWADQPPACGPPNAGQCPPTSFRPRCSAGCCNVSL